MDPPFFYLPPEDPWGPQKSRDAFSQQKKLEASEKIEKLNNHLDEFLLQLPDLVPHTVSVDKEAAIQAAINHYIKAAVAYGETLHKGIDWENAIAYHLGKTAGRNSDEQTAHLQEDIYQAALLFQEKAHRTEQDFLNACDAAMAAIKPFEESAQFGQIATAAQASVFILLIFIGSEEIFGNLDEPL